MIKILDCTKELAQVALDTFGDHYVNANYNLKSGLYDVIFTDQFYTYNVTAHTQLVNITRVPMSGDCCDDTMATMSFDTNDFWKLEVF